MNRVLLTTLSAIACLLSPALLPATASDAEPTPSTPNVIFVLADDLGWAELGCYGNRFNETPHLDRLASQGVRFTQAYAASPVCSPFRAALMTGQYPVRTGINDYLRPNDPKHLSTDLLTLPELFKQRGYATGLIGKWHLTGYASAGAEEVPPTAHGFDEVIVSETHGIGGGSYYHPYHFNPAVDKRLPGPREYLVDRLNREAVDFVQRHREEPFFLYLSHYAVHTRLVGKPELVAKYESKPNAGKGSNAPKNNPHLAAQLETIDQGMGMLLKRLDELGLTDRTIIMFMGDNGGESRVTTNGPLRAGKSTLYEGGIRVPLLMRWPGRIPADTVCDVPVMNIDVYPTLAAIIGAKTNPDQPFDGVSLLPLWNNPAADLGRQALYWYYPLTKPHFLGGVSAAAIRLGDWKLIDEFTTGRLQLFDLKHDLGETTDLAQTMPEKTQELYDRLTAWRTKVGAEVVKHIQAASPPKRSSPR